MPDDHLPPRLFEDHYFEPSKPRGTTDRTSVGSGTASQDPATQPGRSSEAFVGFDSPTSATDQELLSSTSHPPVSNPSPPDGDAASPQATLHDHTHPEIGRGEGENTGGGGGHDQQAVLRTKPEGWGKPIPLDRGFERVGLFDPQLLPAPVRDYVVDLSELNSLPVEQFLPALFVALGGVVGNTWRMFPQAHTGWQVVPALWGMLVSRPASKKSPAADAILKPVRSIDRRLQKEADSTRDNLEARRIVLRKRLDHLEKGLEQAFQSGESVETIQTEIARVTAELRELRLPVRALLVQDATPEKLMELQRDNPRGLIVFRDELGALLDIASKSGREGELQYLMESWNSAREFKQSRIGRGEIRVERNTLAIMGNIQPEVLAAHRAGKALSRGDGLLPRFQVVVYLDDLPPFRLEDRPPNSAAEEAYIRVVEGLFALDPKARGFEDYGELRFDGEAQSRFNGWLEALENRLRDPEIASSPGFQAHLGKYRSLLPAIAAIYHLVHIVTSDVGHRVPLASLEDAIATVDYLERHARRVYRGELAPDVHLAAQLLVRLRGLGLEDDTITVRDLARKGWSGITHNTLPEALACLEEYGWVRCERRATGGRPSDVVRLHPVLRHRHTLHARGVPRT